MRDGMARVPSLARQVSQRVPTAVGLEDLVGYGNEAVVTAARTFDPGRGVPFGAWATLRIRGAMLDGVRAWSRGERSWLRSVRAQEASDAVEEAYLEDHASGRSVDQADHRLSECLTGLATAMAVSLAASEEPSAEDRMLQEEFVQSVRAAVNGLPDNERRLVEAFHYEGQTLEEAAREQGLSKSWGSRLHARAIERIAAALTPCGGTKGLPIK